jgi:hypothetical protein
MVGRLFLPLLASLLLAMQGVSAAAMPVALPPVVDAQVVAHAVVPAVVQAVVPVVDHTTAEDTLPECHRAASHTANPAVDSSSSVPGNASCGCDCLHAIALPVAALPALRPVLIRFAVVVPSLAGPVVNLSRELRPPIPAQG